MGHQTLNNRINGQKSRQQADQDHQLLSPEQELALVDWVDLCAITAKPLDITGVQTMAFELSGSVPGVNWHLQFQARHPEILASKPSGLDPKL